MNRVIADGWEARRTYHHSAIPPALVAANRACSISVCLPARDEAATIGAILEDLIPLLGLGLIDQVVVVDDSTDATAEIARSHGAEVHAQSSLCPSLGPVRGKGDAMWRALTVLWGEVVCYLDADSRQFGPHYATALAGLVACDRSVAFAKGFYRRPFDAGGVVHDHGGGRVTELTARPLLAAFYPELAGVRQPLAGEIAARRELLMALPFLCGYSVDVALLIDAWRAVGLERLAQVDLDVRQNRHRPLHELGAMASAVAGGVLHKARSDGLVRVAPDVVERPPMATFVLSGGPNRSHVPVISVTPPAR
jgi:glucosyl-3-phosphoglycerate synthase